jgi:hypothetical protein
MASSEQRQDRRIVFWIAGSIFGLIVLFSIFGPRTVAADSRPSSTNAQARGVKAAYLLLSELGYSTARWTTPETGLREVDPTRTTLILAEPQLPLRDKKMLEDAIADFLSRGGRVLATGESGAQLLPGGQTALSTRAQLLPGRGGGKGQLAEAAELCQTHPESSGVLARAGKVTLEDGARWTAEGPQYKVEQRCGPDAVVVAFPTARGRPSGGARRRLFRTAASVRKVCWTRMASKKLRRRRISGWCWPASARPSAAFCSTNTCRSFMKA